jgi:hypothetical protein
LIVLPRLVIKSVHKIGSSNGGEGNFPPGMKMFKCDKCGKETNKSSLCDGKWLCPDCYPFLGNWSHVEKIKSRVRMPDGKVIQGYEGQKIMTARLKTQEKARKYEI